MTDPRYNHDAMWRAIAIGQVARELLAGSLTDREQVFLDLIVSLVFRVGCLESRGLLPDSFSFVGG